MPLLKVQWLMYLIRVVYWQRNMFYVNVDPLNCNASHFIILPCTTSDKFYSSMEGSYALVDKIRHRAHRHLIRYYILPILLHLDKTLLEILTDDIELTKEERDAIEKLTPGHILMFATGTPSAPVIGFNPKPSIKFVHDDAKLIPSAHTCGNVLYVYINQKTITGPLHYYMLTALMNGGVFSRI